jgi:Co/Zn/Cd efflux system component
VPDALGSILVGLLLAVVAVMLIQKNRRFLVGVSVQPQIRAAALQTLLDHPEVSSVSFLHIEYVGPSRDFLVADVDLVGDEAEHTVARRLKDLEDKLQAHPRVVCATLTLSRPWDPPITL